MRIFPPVVYSNQVLTADLQLKTLILKTRFTDTTMVAAEV